MSRREKILLALTGVVAVFGLWYGLGAHGPHGPVVPPGGDEAGKAGALLATIKESSMTPAEIDLVTAISTPWPEKAFYDKPFADQAVKPVSRPRFTGYVELGSGKLAVVDGMEYQVGDSLESGGYKVTSITPDEVGLESLANGQRITIPYEGLEAPKQ